MSSDALAISQMVLSLFQKKSRPKKTSIVIAAKTPLLGLPEETSKYFDSNFTSSLTGALNNPQSKFSHRKYLGMTTFF